MTALMIGLSAGAALLGVAGGFAWGLRSDIRRGLAARRERLSHLDQGSAGGT